MKFKRLYIDGCGAPLVAMQGAYGHELHLYDYDGICHMVKSISLAEFDLRNEYLIAKTSLEIYARDKNVKL